MKPNKLSPSELINSKNLVYFPPKKLKTDNEHYPAKIIDGFIYRGRVRVELTTLEDRKIRSVSINRLGRHDDLLEE